MIRVGIPRALLYYNYYPMWKTFFQHLGGEVVVSPPTTRAVVALGSSRVVTDTCLPLKVYCGHVLSLVDQCDYIFAPAIRSVEKNVHNCSNFLGLPDVVKAAIPECPPLLEPDIDVGQGKRALYEALYRLGRHFTWNPFKVKEASEGAWQAYQEYQRLMREEDVPLPEAIAELTGEQLSPESNSENGEFSPTMTIALIGHPYIVYDDYANHRLTSRLRAMRVRLVTAEMVTEEELDRGVASLGGKFYWTQEEEVVGAGGHYLTSEEVDGIIGVAAFGCGPDSIMIDLLKHHAKRTQAKPMMCLTIDEHTAEAGLITRLEAFVDMLERRKSKMGREA